MMIRPTFVAIAMMLSVAPQGSLRADSPRWCPAPQEPLAAPEPATEEPGGASSHEVVPVANWLASNPGIDQANWSESQDASTRMAIRTAFFLAALAAAAGAITLFSRWVRPLRKERRQAMIQCLGSQRITSRANISVYEVNQRQFLLAHDQAGIRCLIPLETSFSEALEQVEPPALSLFGESSILGREMARPPVREEVAWTPPTPRW
ncbi:MAG: hypothetical protein O2931_04450 [Planctomycetota bacterium]|nr:hypothetical protein [Planctomycetota bacterium]MDA1178031.1 hypothetical protein [Planctomycetota bacterium]